jgi:hypothetical protein
MCGSGEAIQYKKRMPIGELTSYANSLVRDRKSAKKGSATRPDLPVQIGTPTIGTFLIWE